MGAPAVTAHLADAAHRNRYWKDRQVGLLLQSEYQDAVKGLALRFTPSLPYHQVKMAFTCHCGAKLTGVIPLFQHLRRSIKRRLLVILYCDTW